MFKSFPVFRHCTGFIKALPTKPLEVEHRGGTVDQKTFAHIQCFTVLEAVEPPFFHHIRARGDISGKGSRLHTRKALGNPDSTNIEDTVH